MSHVLLNQTILFDSLVQVGKHQYYLHPNKSAFHKQGLLNLFFKGHVPSVELRQFASQLNFPTLNAQVRHLVAYETFDRPNGATHWSFSGYSLFPLYKTDVINGRAVVKEAFYVKLNDREIACSDKPVPVSALFHSGLKSPQDSVDYLNTLIELDMESLKTYYDELPAPYALNLYISSQQPEAFERPLFIEVMDKHSGKIVLASYPTTDIDLTLARIKEISKTRRYYGDREIAHHSNGEPYISLNYDSQSINLTKSGDFGEHEYLVQRIRTAMKRGYAPRISVLTSDRQWYEFNQIVLGNNLYVELPAFTELDHA